MAKFLLGLAIVGFTTFCGYLLSRKYRKRKVFFTEWDEFNERFLTELSYYRRPIIEWIGELSLRAEFGEIVEDFSKTTATQGRETPMLLEGTDCYFLTAEEKRRVKQYFYSLGKGDSISQKNQFSAMKETLQASRKKVEEDEKKYGDLYVKVGFLFGLFVLILIV